ncbi:MAG: DUF3179 domain-containing protein [Deltaproteobacteria bacterium]|nr:DUF3179 domain-containing protein [Deltaproteobacteria bacterium]
MNISQLPKGYALSGGKGPHPIPKDYLTFGSSGLLYRSNKLMYDRNTDTLWHQMSGTPALGPLVGSGIQLAQMPLTLTTWKAWYADHLDTKVMAFDTGYKRDYGVDAAYREYFDSPDTMFPVWRRSDLLPTKTWVFTQIINDHPKAYPLSVLKDKRVVNDALGGENLVVLYDNGGHGARAYKRGTHRFSVSGTDSDSHIRDEAGNNWQVTENALMRSNEQLTRLPGHMSFWFGWYSFYPKTEVYGFPASG